MNQDEKPGFLKRFFLALIKTIFTALILVVLVAVGAGAYWSFQEIQRSFGSVTARVDINRRDIESLGNEIDALAAEVPDRQRDISMLQEGTGDIESRLSNLQTAMAEDLERQQQLLAVLEQNIATAIENNEVAIEGVQTANDDTAALGAALVALQGDLNESNSRIDALGGEIDGVQGDIGELDSSVSDLGQSVTLAVEAAAEVTDMGQTLALFHVWELVARARFRLAEDNVGLATADAARALRMLDALITAGPPESVETLEIVQTRLSLASTSLPDSPAIAVSDLASAWDELDKILIARILPDLAAEIEAEAAEAEIEAEEVAPEPTPTPSP